MKIYWGQFSALERTLADFLAENRSGPLAPVLMVVPSARMTAYLSRKLALRGGAFANVTFETFSTLATRLAFETLRVKPALAGKGEGLPPVISSPGFQDFLLRAVLELYPPPAGAVTRGFAAAVRESVRDLTDALVDSAAVLDLAEDGAFDQLGDAESVRWLLQVRAAYMAELEKLPALSRFELYEQAIENAPGSRYLARFEHIIYYGFYELTGVQLEFFNAVRQNFGVTLFYPHENRPALRHAGRFFDTHFAGYARETTRLEAESSALAAAEEHLFSPDGGRAPVPEKALRVAAVSGAREELKFAAREILRLAEEEGCEFSDIALAARSLEPYAPLIEPVLTEYGIPFRAAVSLPLLSYPSALFIKNLLNLRRGGYTVEGVRAVWSAGQFAAPGGQARAARICGYMASAGVTRGLQQWRQLFSAERAGRFRSDFAKADLEAFASWLDQTDRALAALERAGAWRGLCGAAKNLVLANMAAEPDLAAQTALETIAGLELYGLVRAARENEFLDEAERALAAEALPCGGSAQAGVDVVDAMSARGRTYRAVIVLGLNEKKFPRLIREDPVLRDSARRVLRDTLGYWLAPKLDGYDEERLLFYYLLNSARERVTCVWQLSDEDGRALVMSSFLAELMRACGIAPDNAAVCRTVARRLSEQFAQTGERYLSGPDFALKIALSPDADRHYAEAGLGGGFFEPLRAAAKEIGAAGAAGGFDGITGAPQPHLLKLRDRGFSPSALEELGKCPMKYFFSRVLGLAGQEAGCALHEPDAREIGSLYHSVLKKTCEELLALGFWRAPEPDRALLLAAKNFEELAPARLAGVYPLIWEILRGEMLAALKAFAQANARTTAEAGLVPTYFEQPLAAFLPELKGYRCAGIADRIDVCEADGTFLVVDYKKKLTGQKSLKKDVLRGESFQPYLYFLMTPETLAPLRGFKPRGTLLAGIEHYLPESKGVAERALSASDWNEIAARAGETLGFLVSLAEQGGFFINPREGIGQWCEYCDYSRACRKNHHASFRRARLSALFKAREKLAEGGEPDDQA